MDHDGHVPMGDGVDEVHVLTLRRLCVLSLRLPLWPAPPLLSGWACIFKPPSPLPSNHCPALHLAQWPITTHCQRRKSSLRLLSTRCTARHPRACTRECIALHETHSPFASLQPSLTTCDTNRPRDSLIVHIHPYRGLTVSFSRQLDCALAAST